MIALSTVAPRLTTIDAEQRTILDRVEHRGGWRSGELDRFRALSAEFDSLAKIAELFVALDDRHFSGRLAAAGVTVDLADLSHDGADGSYFIAASVIRLSRRLAPEDIGKVLLHELGHAACHVIDGYDGPANSHGREFQQWCSRLGESHGLAPPTNSSDAERWPFCNADPVEAEVQKRMDAKRQMARNGWLCNMVEAERNIRRQVESEYQSWKQSEALIQASRHSPSAANLVLTRGLRHRDSPF